MVNPARAGMILSSAAWRRALRGKPRASGYDPFRILPSISVVV